VTVHITRFRGDASQVVEENGSRYETVVACGGDGTFNEVVAGAMKSNYNGTIGFLPCGTTNDLADTMVLPKNPVQAAKIIAQCPGKYMDFGWLNQSRYFSYVASFGAFSEVAYSTDQKMKNLFGHAAYVTEALSHLKKVRTYHMTVECDGERYEDDFLFGAVSNSLSIGGVVKLKKREVNLDDGLHEVLLIPNPKRAADIGNLPIELFSGNFENKSVLFFRGKRIVFHCEEPISWCVDGEYAGDHNTVEIQNLHRRLKIIRP